MDIRPLTPAYAVSPQVNPEDFAAIAAAGFTTVINNRPCVEIPPSHHADRMRDAAQAAGLTFVTLPLTHDTMNETTANAQKAACDASSGPVFAYCASGTRCTIIWAFSRARDMTPDDIIAAAAAQGYDISMMRHQLSQLHGT
ncbi:TIGR01244 family sulfur transferase [Octadecabacter sp. G9-8]|uniref:TIGR01244 family sulfur transferase n=1 Tax=Octadecabacter dasysiphoniae TaxID=2909341 RepID=A0ABS9CSZ5_9RHOB|nr:TIGR01244 family sulfur transferase [Octadecabacter dasysiphoniae]MCF2870298.1 TIGR01244 family sulfur transferase [Octadecabacter dasysiphoniae]